MVVAVTGVSIENILLLFLIAFLYVVHNGLNDRTIEVFSTFCVFLCKIISKSLFADAECLMNAKLVPIPLFDKKTKAPIDRSNPDTQRGIK